MCNLTGGTVRCKVDFQAGERVRAKPALMITSDDRSAEKTVTDASPTKDLINGFSHCRYKTFQKFLRYFPRSDRRPKTKQSADHRQTAEKRDRAYPLRTGTRGTVVYHSGHHPGLPPALRQPLCTHIFQTPDRGAAQGRGAGDCQQVQRHTDRIREILRFTAHQFR